MNSFPPSFNSENSKFIPYPTDQLKPILCQIRADIVAEVEKHRQQHEDVVYFYITRCGKIKSVGSIDDLEKISQIDFDKHANDSESIRENYKYILKTIGDELNQSFGHNFKTSHETHWNSDSMALYPIDERECSGQCCIQFVK